MRRCCASCARRKNGLRVLLSSEAFYFYYMFVCLLTMFCVLLENSRLSIDEDDVSLVFEDLHRGRSVIPPHDIPKRPTLTRWDWNRPLTLENVVVMHAEDAKRHVAAFKDGKGNEIWGEEVSRVVERRKVEIEGWKDAVM